MAEMTGPLHAVVMIMKDSARGFSQVITGEKALCPNERRLTPQVCACSNLDKMGLGSRINEIHEGVRQASVEGPPDGTEEDLQHVIHSWDAPTTFYLISDTMRGVTKWRAILSYTTRIWMYSFQIRFTTYFL